MTGDSTEEFQMALDGEGGLGLSSSRRHGTGASLASTTTMSWPENVAPTTQVMSMIPHHPTVPRLDTDIPVEQRHTH
jgi:hypothetical protein